MSQASFPRLGASVKLGSVLGIPIRLHFTFLLLVGWLGWQAATRGGDAGFWFVLLLLLFACVVLHELGHASMAMLFGVRTREIILLPIGGLAKLERIPAGIAELLIAIAGPAVNLALCLLFSIVGLLFGLPEPWNGDPSLGVQSMIWMLVFANLSLMLFKLLPAFPMDGGRVLRGVLHFFMPIENATHWASRVGQGMAILFFVVGLSLPNPFLVLIAVLVFIGAAQELYSQRSRTRLAGKTARDAMITRFETLAPQDSINRAADLLRQGEQQVYPVIDGWGRLAGGVTRATLFAVLSEGRGSTPLLEVMEREPPTIEPDVPLEAVLEKLQLARGLPVFVFDDSGLLGLVTASRIGELAELESRSGR